MDNGFLELKSDIDLLAKLRHDLALLKTKPLDTYLAMNFFMTAECLVDWHLPGNANRKQRERLREAHVILAISSHIANGVKHFAIEAKHHRSVQKVDRSSFYDEFYDDFYDDFYDQLVVVLDDEAKTLLGPTIGIESLAEQVTEFWKLHLAKP